ncbi:hypothetical protein L0244_23140 [bacterium]|nr:hypothetical protein [bacterium]MCI0615891.1 hypothetical protein [bacterium]
MEFIEEVFSDGKLLAFVIRNELSPNATTFVTPSDLNLQLGFVVYPNGGQVLRHMHLPIERTIYSTTEIVHVKKGRCIMDIYDDQRILVTSVDLKIGDTVLMIGGGHGFRMLEDTVLLEIKQGPYSGIQEKVRF